MTGIDAMCPSSKEEFNEFERLLKEKLCQFEKSVHYSSFLESLFRELCISCERPAFSRRTAVDCEFASTHLCFSPLTVEVDDLKKVSNSLSVLLSEKQKQEKVSDFFSPSPHIHNQFRWPPTGGAVVPVGHVTSAFFHFTAKQRQEEEESGLARRLESTDER